MISSITRMKKIISKIRKIYLQTLKNFRKENREKIEL